MGFAYEIHKAELQRDKELKALRAQGQLISDAHGASKLVGELPRVDTSQGADRFAKGRITVVVTKPAVVEGTRYTPGEYDVTLKHFLHLQHQAAATEKHKLQWDFWNAPGRILAAEPCEARPHSLEYTDGALRIVQGCGYDPGNAAFRQHTLVNETTKHVSTFVRFGDTNPFCSLRQLDGDTQLHEARSAVYTADVIHAHVDYTLQGKTGFKWRPRWEQLVVRHYHGTRPGLPRAKQWPLMCMKEDDLANVVIVGARLTLCDVRPQRMSWLPIAVPVRRLHAMVPKTRRPGPFRIAHSPSRRDYKGTQELLWAVETLTKKGLKIELVMIEKQPYAEALRLKTDADMTFDSLWLGLQGSGLEGAAMGQMVVAGDEDVKALYETMDDRQGQRYVGYCPYTFANTRTQLAEVIERAITDVDWYKAEVKRVAKYVMQYHDYAAVGKRYEAILAEHMGPSVFTTTKKKVAR